MSGRRRGNAGKGFSSFLYMIVFALIVVAFTQFYPRYQRTQQYTADLNQVRNDFSSQKWDAAIDGYLALWAAYPDREKQDANNLAAAYENWGTDLYINSLKTKSKWKVVSTQFEHAAALRPLSEKSLISLGDCYIEQKDYEKCKVLIRQVEHSGGLSKGKFSILKKRLAQAEAGKKKKKKK